MPNLSNAETREPIERREIFTTNAATIFPRKTSNLYIVYSWGTHFPMWVYDGDLNQWFGNSDRYSRSTSKHQSLSRPNAQIDMCDTATLQQIIAWDSYTEYAAYRVQREVAA